MPGIGPLFYPRLLARLGLVCLAASLVGCGGRVYEGRLEESKKYYEFIEKQNVNLAPSWEGSGMRLRVPAQFVQIPPPVVERDKKTGRVIRTGPDNRQPDFIPGGLPGMVAAWKADSRSAPPAYLFVLSNHDLWLDDKAKEDAPKFHAIVVRTLCSGLRSPQPAEEKWKLDKYPATDSYNEPKSYRVADIDPRPEIDGVKYDVRTYLHVNGEMQAALILMVPEGVNPSGGAHPQAVPLSQRMALALETFSLAGTKPLKPKAGAGPGGAFPAGPRPF